MNILDQILAQKTEDVIFEKKNYPLSYLTESTYFDRTCISLKKNLQTLKFGIIAEIKRKSPSMGDINTALNPIEIASMYEQAGVAGISVLTDHHYFGGSLSDLSDVRAHVNIPLLRKEFIIDEYQILTAKAFGADCILLIAEALEKKQLFDLAQVAHKLGLEVLMEIHSLEQLEKINEYITILGVNNRDLKQQKTDLQISKQLFPFLPKDMVTITESGIQTPKDLEEMASIGYQGALIGSSIVGNTDPKEQLARLCNAMSI